MASLYAAKVSWMDHCFGRFLDAFYESGLSKNTAILLVGDHGTKTGHYGTFGKGSPVRDAEARIPLFIRLPHGAASRSDTIVQPQDLTATILGLANATMPHCVGHDLPTGRTDREVAVAGPAAGSATKEATIFNWDPNYFSVFGRDAWLEWQPTPEASILRHYGSEDPIAGLDEELQRLHELGVAEIGRRDTHPEILVWLEGGARDELSPDIPRHVRWPGVEGFTQYFKRTYYGE